MLSNMASSLIMHKRITTTVAKAKALRMYVEPIITRSKEDTTHNRRVVFSLLQNKESVSELFREVSIKVADRPGGYTRILKLGARFGDNAEMCIIELVDYNTSLLEAKETEAKQSKRSRRGSKKKTDDAVVKEVKTKPIAKEEKIAKETQEIVEELNDDAEETIENIENVIEEVAETTEEKVEDIVEEVTETIEEKVDEVVEEAKDVIEEIKEELSEIVSEVSEEVKEIIEDIDDDKKNTEEK